MTTNQFLQKFYSFRLNLLINIMNTIDCTKIYEMAVNERIDRKAIIRAIDETLLLEKFAEGRDRYIVFELKKLKNIFLDGVGVYQPSLID